MVVWSGLYLIALSSRWSTTCREPVRVAGHGDVLVDGGGQLQGQFLGAAAFQVGADVSGDAGQQHGQGGLGFLAVVGEERQHADDLGAAVHR